MIPLAAVATVLLPPPLTGTALLWLTPVPLLTPPALVLPPLTAAVVPLPVPLITLAAAPVAAVAPDTLAPTDFGR